MKKLTILIALLAGLSSCNNDNSSQSQRESFNFDWKFSLEADSTSIDNSIDDSSWRVLDLPHDWAIEGDFSESHPSTAGCGALPGGFGVYRKKFYLPQEDSSKIIKIAFDGVHWKSSVYVNGKKIGFRPSGYSSFEYDITNDVIFGQENLIAVTVDNADQPNSRWYAGCGIYRNTYLKKLNKIHIANNGTFVETQIENGKAKVNIQSTIENQNTTDEIIIEHQILDKQNNIVASSCQRSTSAFGLSQDNQLLELDVFNRWDIDNPYVYSVNTIIKDSKNNILDNYKSTFGIREFEFNKETGFWLNGKNIKINGVCNHHDLGALGSAFNVKAAHRQLQILKEMGCNAIRTSHNMPARELLDLCDTMGFIVMDEAFDMWAKKKTSFDYSTYFAAWHEKDLTDFIIRDRNHPSVIMWSIGNEILEQWPDINTDTLDIAKANLMFNFAAQLSQNKDNQTSDMHVNSLLCKKLVDLVKSLDKSRPVTCGNNETEPFNLLFKSNSLDIIGFNYHEYNWGEAFKQKFQNLPLIVTESTSALMTRGNYIMPADTQYLWPVRWDIPFETDHHQCSAYDNVRAPWGSTHETTLKEYMKYSWCSGIFVWTGFDYLGEPTPYGWPSRSSYFGIIDLAGFPKDVYYLYQSLWTDKPVLHILPHWNWNEGKKIDVVVYSNFDKVELFLNGESLGEKQKENGQLHFSWKVDYKAGELKAIGKNPNGKTKEEVIYTSSKPAKLIAKADCSQILADGYDLSFVTVDILDKDNHFVPNANNQIEFIVEGACEIAGVDCGNPICHQNFKSNIHNAFNGKCLLIVKSKRNQKGEIKVVAKSNGLEESSIVINAK